jgi:hypothetical protein
VLNPSTVEEVHKDFKTLFNLKKKQFDTKFETVFGLNEKKFQNDEVLKKFKEGGL